MHYCYDQIPDFRPTAMALFYDSLVQYKDFKSRGRAEKVLSKMGVTEGEYLYLLSPALDWLLRVIAKDAPRESFTTVMGHYRDLSNSCQVRPPLLPTRRLNGMSQSCPTRLIYMKVKKGRREGEASGTS